MNITATELKNNVSKYLNISKSEDVFITKNGKVISKLTSPFNNRIENLRSIFGILPSDIDEEAILAERASKIWN